jgi:hypothetical protein
MSRTVMRRPSPGLQGRAEGLSIAKAPFSGAPRESRDRARDRRPLGGTPSDHVGERLLDLAASLGLSLLITAGFAAALGLYSHTAPFSPHVIDACGGVFLWSWAVFSCATSSRSRYDEPGREKGMELKTRQVRFASGTTGDQESEELKNYSREEKKP